MNTRINMPRTAGVLAVIAAGALTGFGAAFAAAATNDREGPDERTPPTELVEYARDHDLSGLSPASLQPSTSSAYDDLDQIEEYARSAGLTGLSPASLHATEPNP